MKKTTAQRRGRTVTAGESEFPLSTLLRYCGYGLLCAMLLCLILMPIFGWIAYSFSDPDQMTVPAAYVTLAITALAAGFASVKFNGGEDPLLCGIVSGGMLCLLMMGTSLFFKKSDINALSPFLTAAAYAAIPTTALLGALMAVKRNRSNHHRRKK